MTVSNIAEYPTQSVLFLASYLVETGHPEVCTAQEKDQNHPEEPGVQLAVAVQGGA